MLMAEPLIMHSTVVFVYVETIIIGGVLAYLYRQFLWERLRRRQPYQVQDVTRLNGTVAQVTLRPQGRHLNHRAGQFLYVHFDVDKTLREPHPFTISSAPHEHDVRLSIKSSGDWTQHLHEHLASGARAFVDGPYGEFNYKTGGPRQLWIAAGIGLTPFLSWIRDLQGDAPKHEIEFFYTTTVAEEALFLDEIRLVAARPGLRAHILHTSRDGRLSVDKIVEATDDPSDRDIYMCGPIAMVEAFRSAFMARGVPRSRIHYEEFNFR
jgi:predicted ferric reductase